MRTLLFDIDGTLMVTDGVGGDALASVMRQEFGLESPDVNLSYSGRTDRSLINELLTRNQLPVEPSYFDRLRDAYFAVLPDVLRKNGGRLLPGVPDVLETCRQADDVRTCVMTGNCDESAKAKLNHFELLDHFEDVFGGEFDAHRDDMARRTRGMVAQRYGAASADRLVVIGDTPADIQCGKAIDAVTIGVCTGNHDRDALVVHDPDHVFDDLTDPAVIDILLR